MANHYVHKTGGRTCSSEVSFDIDNGIIKNVHFVNGCRGNTTGVAALCEGMNAEEVVKRLAGTPCRGSSSCPNELAMAVKAAMEIEAQKA